MKRQPPQQNPSSPEPSLPTTADAPADTDDSLFAPDWFPLSLWVPRYFASEDEAERILHARGVEITFKGGVPCAASSVGDQLRAEREAEATRQREADEALTQQLTAAQAPMFARIAALQRGQNALLDAGLVGASSSAHDVITAAEHAEAMERAGRMRDEYLAGERTGVIGYGHRIGPDDQ